MAPTCRALIWGLGLPLAVLLGVFMSPWALILLLGWPAQVLRLRLRGMSWAEAFSFTLGKLPEAQGILGYWMSRLRGVVPRIIEYK